MSTEVPSGPQSGVVPPKVRRLQGYADSITRLAIPAAHRDELGLSDGQTVVFRLECRESEPVVLIDAEPENPDPDAGAHVRPVQIDASTGQATVNFPATLADVLGYRNTDLEVDTDGGAIVVRPR